MSYKEPLCFVAGAVVGAVVGIFAVKRKYECYANEQIEECRHGYNHKLYELSQQNRNKPPLSTIVKEAGGATNTYEYKPDVVEDYSEEDDPEDPVIAVNEPVITIIDDDEYAYNGRYNKESVIIYRDGTVARDDNDDVIDVSETIGADAYERALHDPDPDEPVYVRNETTQTDYEILLSQKTYTEATGIFLRGMD